MSNLSEQTTQIAENADYAARYVGPGPESVNLVVVSFPDLKQPPGFDQKGWAEAFFSKRGIAQVSILFKRIDWFQSSGFFEIIQSVKDFLGPSIEVATYGSSMGGLGALLAAKRLNATRAIALCPQYSIEPEIVPFEKRYDAFLPEIEKFQNRLEQELSKAPSYIVAFDPTHWADKKHAKLFPELNNWCRIPVYGAGHGVLQMLVDANLQDVLADTLVGRVAPRDLRSALRRERKTSFKYIRKIGNLTKDRSGEPADSIVKLGKNSGFEKLLEKWGVSKNQYDKIKKKIIIHVGLPKTGTTSIQAYLFNNAEHLRRVGVYYPTNLVDARALNHAWVSNDLREGKVERFAHMLNASPNDVGTVVVSDENLFVEEPGLSLVAKEKLQDLMQSYDTQILYVDRALPDWKKSFYLQSVQNRRRNRKTGEQWADQLWQSPKKFEEFFQTPYAQKLLDRENVLSQLAKQFNARDVIKIDYITGQDITSSFCEALDLPVLPKKPASKNKSLKDVEGEILRQANAIGIPTGRFVKQALALSSDFKPENLRARKLQNLANLATGADLGKVVFTKNPPLVFSRKDFDQAVLKLKKISEQLVVFAD